MQGPAQSGKDNPKHSRGSGPSQQVIPDAVANRMARRIAIGTGIPTLMGMSVFVGSYLLVSRQIFDVPPSATLLASGGCFFLGLLGLSFGVLSASWEEKPGSLLGTEQIGLNISRLRSSIKATRNGAGN
ncbi:MAG: PAM68 family protein [Cyanobacteria bacterium]|nr:PAM68 family protein [Cyanobacteriota bacterium]